MAKKRSYGRDEEGGDVDTENRENGASYDYDVGDIGEEGDEVGDDDDRHHHQRRRKKKKKFRVMNASLQTEDERRGLRQRQRNLKNDISMGAAAAAGKGGGDDGEGEQWQRLREQNNELWSEVRYTREAVLDSENVDLIADKAARRAEKIVQVPRYDAIRLAQQLVKKGTVGTGPHAQFNWHGLGFQVGVCFNALPSHVGFLYGPLDAEYAPKERKKPERRSQKSQQEAESEGEEEDEPQSVDQRRKEKKTGNELSAVEKHIKVIRGTLEEKTQEHRDLAKAEAEEFATQLSQRIDDEREVKERKKRFVKERSQVDAVNCLFNPSSFTQTVENIFHFSFLVKQGEASIKARSAEDAEEYGGVPGPAIRAMPRSSNISTHSQAIVSLNMKDWKDMCRAYNVERSDVPHRVDGKVGKKEKKDRKSG